MHDDDRPVGRFLTRRELMAVFGASTPIAAMTRRVTALTSTGACAPLPGAQLILPVVENGAGYAATFEIAMRPGA